MGNIYENYPWILELEDPIVNKFLPDINFYVDYALSRRNESVLELGCGTGRVTLELLKKKINVTGIDISLLMINRIKKKLENLPDAKKYATIKQDDMTNFSFNEKFGIIIIPFHVFQLVIDNESIENMFQCIKECMDEDSKFIINVFNPYSNELDSSWCYPKKIEWIERDLKTDNKVVKETWGEKIDLEQQIMYTGVKYTITPTTMESYIIYDEYVMKYYYPEQLRNILENNGFIINEEFGWYDKTPIQKNKGDIIYVCSKSY